MKYACANCGKKHRSTDTMIYSSWTKNRYCAFNHNACQARAKRRRRTRIASAASS